ncbi:MAG: hypothetical protein ACPLZC_06515 [Candidatus Bathyarchaeales archaeon]
MNVLENDEDFEESQTIDVVLLVLCFFACAFLGYFLAKYLGF